MQLNIVFLVAVKKSFNSKFSFLCSSDQAFRPVISHSFAFFGVVNNALNALTTCHP